MEMTFERDYEVRYAEVGAGGRLRPVALLDWLQDAAGAHADRLGVGVASLQARGLTWVLSRLHLEAVRWPGPAERVRVRTWPSTRSGLLTCREFEVFDVTGEPVARATTAWVLVEMARRRPVRLERALPDYPLFARRAVTDPFPSLPGAGEAAGEERYAVRRADLDVNRHVNNAVYVGWALESVPAPVAEHCFPISIEAGYRAEALAGETVLARCAVEHAPGTSTIHELLRETDGKELARARVRWGQGASERCDC